jgi:hypothetical protein
MRGNYGPYSKICELASQDEEVFKMFKSHPEYSYVLEHPNYNDFGKQFLRTIKKYCSELQLVLPWEKILVNDYLGTPEVFSYDFTNELTTSASPTTLRYVKTAIQILRHLKSKYDGDDINIVEIGGGYGGQAFVLFTMASLFDVNIKSYTMFDLEASSKLQRKYIHNLSDHIQTDKFDFRMYNKSSFSIKENSFVISNYSLSEVDETVKQSYFTNIFPNITGGFFCWNFGLTENPVSEFLSRNYYLTIEPENNPRTGPNVFVMF